MKLFEIATRLGCELRGDAAIEIQGVASLDDAQPGHLTFVANRKYIAKANGTRASAVIVATNFREIPAATLRTDNPYLAFARAVELFYRPPLPAPGVHPSACIAPTARIGARASIGPYVVVDDDVEIGDDCTCLPFVHIGRGVRVGDRFLGHSHSVVREFCHIGNRVTLQAGAKIGTDGYGYARQDDGSYYKIVQSGIVVLEDDVEIGANTTVDRPTFGETRIRRGAKIDNLVQIGHACQVGDHALLCAQVGLAGSTKVGRQVILAGQVGAAGHLEIGDGAVVTAQSGIASSLDGGRVFSGTPALANRNWRKSAAVFRRLPELLKRIEALDHSGATRPRP